MIHFMCSLQVESAVKDYVIPISWLLFRRHIYVTRQACRTRVAHIFEGELVSQTRTYTVAATAGDQLSAVFQSFGRVHILALKLQALVAICQGRLTLEPFWKTGTGELIQLEI
jgi:hypothetical protein